MNEESELSKALQDSIYLENRLAAFVTKEDYDALVKEMNSLKGVVAKMQYREEA